MTLAALILAAALASYALGHHRGRMAERRRAIREAIARMLGGVVPELFPPEGPTDGR